MGIGSATAAVALPAQQMLQLAALAQSQQQAQEVLSVIASGGQASPSSNPDLGQMLDLSV